MGGNWKTVKCISSALCFNMCYRALSGMWDIWDSCLPLMYWIIWLFLGPNCIIKALFDNTFQLSRRKRYFLSYFFESELCVVAVKRRDECWGPSGRQPWPQCVDDFTSHILCCTDCFNLPWWRRRLNSFCHWIITHTCWHTCECVYAHALTLIAYGNTAHMDYSFSTQPHGYVDILHLFMSPGSDLNLVRWSTGGSGLRLAAKSLTHRWTNSYSRLEEPPDFDCCPSNTRQQQQCI